LSSLQLMSTLQALYVDLDGVAAVASEAWARCTDIETALITTRAPTTAR